MVVLGMLKLLEELKSRVEVGVDVERVLGGLKRGQTRNVLRQRVVPAAWVASLCLYWCLYLYLCLYLCRCWSLCLFPSACFHVILCPCPVLILCWSVLIRWDGRVHLRDDGAREQHDGLGSLHPHGLGQAECCRDAALAHGHMGGGGQGRRHSVAKPVVSSGCGSRGGSGREKEQLGASGEQSVAWMAQVGVGEDVMCQVGCGRQRFQQTFAPSPDGGSECRGGARGRRRPRLDAASRV